MQIAAIVNPPHLAQLFLAIGSLALLCGFLWRLLVEQPFLGLYALAERALDSYQLRRLANKRGKTRQTMASQLSQPS